jgi:hypothetical protein
MQLNLGNPIALAGFASYFASAVLYQAGGKLTHLSRDDKKASCAFQAAKVTAGYAIKASAAMLIILSVSAVGYGTFETLKWYSNNRHLFSIGSLLTQGGGALATLGLVSFWMEMAMVRLGKKMAKNNQPPSTCKTLKSRALINIGAALGAVSIAAVSGGLLVSSSYYLYPFIKTLVNERSFTAAVRILANSDMKAALIFLTITISSATAGCVAPYKMGLYYKSQLKS